MTRKLTKEEFVKKCQSVHGDRYDYSDTIYIDMRHTVDVRCPKHGIFTQMASEHVRRTGCPKCANEHRNDANRVTTDKFIKRAREVHGDKYDYSLVNCERITEYVNIICLEHGIFKQRAAGHLYGSGCPKCAGEFMDTAYFKERAILLHGNKYDYSLVDYVNARTEVKIVCPEHGVFEQQPRVHLSGAGCPKCQYMTSKPEEDLYEKLLTVFGEADIDRQYKDEDRYPFNCDFYIKSLDLFIEFNGFYTHGFHWFDKDNPDDMNKLEKWKARDASDDYGTYENAIYTWTDLDVRKRQKARESNLKYVVLWNEEDVSEWIGQGCPIRQDWK